jgi:hypothetical protein
MLQCRLMYHCDAASKTPQIESLVSRAARISREHSSALLAATVDSQPAGPRPEHLVLRSKSAMTLSKSRLVLLACHSLIHATESLHLVNLLFLMAQWDSVGGVRLVGSRPSSLFHVASAEAQHRSTQTSFFCQEGSDWTSCPWWFSCL